MNYPLNFILRLVRYKNYLQAPKIYLIFGEVVVFSAHLTFARFSYVQPLAAVFLIFGIIALPTIFECSSLQITNRDFVLY